MTAVDQKTKGKDHSEKPLLITHLTKMRDSEYQTPPNVPPNFKGKVDKEEVNVSVGGVNRIEGILAVHNLDAGKHLQTILQGLGKKLEIGIKVDTESLTDPDKMQRVDVVRYSMSEPERDKMAKEFVNAIGSLNDQMLAFKAGAEEYRRLESEQSANYQRRIYQRDEGELQNASGTVRSR